jgi:transposase
MDQQCHYVGLDVSLETTSICVIDDAGAIIWRGKCRSDPDTITAIVRQHAPCAVRVGLETGQLSNWLTLSLRRRGVPVVCMDARHAKVKSMDAHTLRMLLVARSRLVSQRQATANTIRGLLKTFGLVVARGSKGLFPVRVREQIAGNPTDRDYRAAACGLARHS